jgi:hypothetical protein
MTKITMTTKDFSRTESGKSWKSKPDTTESEEITLKQLNLMTCDNTLRFFRNLGGTETVQRTYTSAGFLPYQLTSVNPSRDLRRVREFAID